MAITREEYTSALKSQLEHEDSINKVLALIATGKSFTVKIDATVVKFRDENDKPIAELDRPENFIVDLMNESLEKIKASNLEINAAYLLSTTQN